MTGWQQLEVGIAMGCSISPILYVAAFEIWPEGIKTYGQRAEITIKRKTPSTERVH